MAFNKRWKPSKAQAKAFATNMKDPAYSAAYYERKDAKAIKRRSSSKFDYNIAGGDYIATKEQHDFCFNNILLFTTPEQYEAANMVMTSYVLQEKTSHDYIHIVNEIIRKN
jgi:hypothetical protein